VIKRVARTGLAVALAGVGLFLLFLPSPRKTA
jgi:hypothetical protein